MTWIIALIPLFPLLGFLLNVFIIREERQAGGLATLMVALSFVTAIIAVVVLQGQTGEHARLEFMLWEWIRIGSFRVPFGLLFDQLTAVMVLLVTGVGGLIHFYSIGYMHGGERENKNTRHKERKTRQS